jgi:hypothetical protein
MTLCSSPGASFSSFRLGRSAIRGALPGLRGRLSAGRNGKPSATADKLSSNSGERRVGVQEFCTLSELHPVSVELEVLNVTWLLHGRI